MLLLVTPQTAAASSVSRQTEERIQRVHIQLKRFVVASMTVQAQAERLSNASKSSCLTSLTEISHTEPTPSL